MFQHRIKSHIEKGKFTDFLIERSQFLMNEISSVGDARTLEIACHEDVFT